MSMSMCVLYEFMYICIDEFVSVKVLIWLQNEEWSVGGLFYYCLK